MPDHVINPQKYTVYTFDEPVYVGQGDAGDGEGAGEAASRAAPSAAAAAAAAGRNTERAAGAGAAMHHAVKAATAAAAAWAVVVARVTDEERGQDYRGSRGAAEMEEHGELEGGDGGGGTREPPPAFGTGIAFRPSGGRGNSFVGIMDGLAMGERELRHEGQGVWGMVGVFYMP